MNLYLDDIREAPLGWYRTYTATETIELLKSGKVQVTVFDGYQVLQIAGTTRVEHLVARRDDEEAILRVDAVFADLGLLPNSGVVRQLIPVWAHRG